jgi:hypothetical protein
LATSRSVVTISATLRWLVTSTFSPARISWSASWACMSEKPITRSGCSATILSTLPWRKADTRGFSCRARRGRTV